MARSLRPAAQSAGSAAAVAGPGRGLSSTRRASQLRRRVRRFTQRYGWMAGAVIASILVGLVIGRM